MKVLFILLFGFTLSFSKIYYSKVEPFEIRDISSNVSGLVIFTDEDMLGKRLSNKPYIKIDSDLNQKELKSVQSKLVYINETLNSTKYILVNLEKSLSKKRQNYKRIESLKIKSTVEKDREFHDLINSENLYLNTQKEINNLQIQIADLELREAQLKRIIDDKSLVAKDFVLYSILVKVGQVVGISTPLAKVADISKAKLTIFLDEVDVENSKKKTVYIDGEKTSYKISRLLNIADSKNISKYKAQIIINSPKVFSKLAKIELKDE